MSIRHLSLSMLLAALAPLLLLGCNAQEGTLSADEARELLEELPEAENLDQFRFELSVSFNGLDDLPAEALEDEDVAIDPDELGARMEGGFDQPNQQMHFRFELTGYSFGGDDPLGGLLLGDAFTMEVLRDGEDSWAQLGFFGAFVGLEPGTWLHSVEDADDTIAIEDEFLFDRDDIRELLYGLQGEIEVIGQEELRGADTTHLAVTIGRESFEGDDVWGEVPDELDELEVHLWMDGQGRIHQLELTMPADSDDAMPFGGDIGGPEMAEAFEDATVTFTMALFDYGEPLNLEVPPEGEIVEEDELEGLFGGGFDDDITENGDAESGESVGGNAEFRFFELLDQSPWLEMDFAEEHPELSEELDALVDEAFNADEITTEHVERLEDLLERIEAARGE